MDAKSIFDEMWSSMCIPDWTCPSCGSKNPGNLPASETKLLCSTNSFIDTRQFGTTHQKSTKFCSRSYVHFSQFVQFEFFLHATDFI